MSCISKYLSFDVPACGSAATTLTAAADGEYTFVFNWLGREYRAAQTRVTGETLIIEGNWFNEFARAQGVFLGPDDSPVADENGVSEIHVQVRQSIAL